MKLQRRTVLLTTFLLVAVFGVGLLILASNTRAGNPSFAPRRSEKVNVVKASSSVAVPLSQDDDKGLWLKVRATGFETPEETITAGDYLVVIQNASGLDQIGIRIAREKGERTHEVRMAADKKRWRQMVHFKPGVYIVSEVDHPDWTCRITVTQ